MIDFEATCGAKGSEPKPQEIIEFPCALLNTNKGFEIEAIFHEYVRPVHNPMLTRFCTELTGITQVSMLLIVLEKDIKDFMDELDRGFIGENIPDSYSYDQAKLVEFDNLTSSHPIESIGKTLRMNMSNMKKLK